MMQSPHAPCLSTVCPTINTVPKAHQWHTLSLHILKGPTPPAPTPWFLFSPFFPLISIVTVLSHARAFLLASCHILLLSSCLEVSLSQAGRVELLWVLPAFARCSFGVGSWQAWQPIPTGPLSCDSSLPAGSLKHPFIPLYKWRHGTGFHFLANLHAIAETKKSHTPTPLGDRLS